MGFDDIFEAAKDGTAEDVKRFIEQEGVDIDARDDTNHTVLEFALLGKNAETTKYLMEKGAHFEPHQILDAINWEKDSLETVKLFVEKGVSVNHRDSGMFPLLLAAGCNNMEVAQYLISKGADINMASSSTGLTALALAEQKGNTEMADFLRAQKSKPSPMKIVKIVLIVAGILIFLRACAGCLGLM